MIFVTCLTIFLQHVPLKQFRKVRYVWAWLLMEYYTKHASDLIENRNDLEALYGQNIICFFVFMYLETNSMLTAKILEGLLYFEASVFDFPYLIYDDTFNYIVAVPTLIIA